MWEFAPNMEKLKSLSDWLYAAPLIYVIIWLNDKKKPNLQFLKKSVILLKYMKQQIVALLSFRPNVTWVHLNFWKPT